jgi:hypothetical protein
MIGRGRKQSVLAIAAIHTYQKQAPRRSSLSLDILLEAVP